MIKIGSKKVQNEKPEALISIERVIEEFRTSLSILSITLPNRKTKKKQKWYTSKDNLGDIYNIGDLSIQSLHDNNIYNIIYENDQFKIEFSGISENINRYDIQITKVDKRTNEKTYEEIIYKTSQYGISKYNCSGESLFSYIHLIVTDLIIELLKNGEIGMGIIEQHRKYFKGNKHLRIALEQHLETTPIGKFPGLVKEILKGSCISESQFNEIGSILTGINGITNHEFSFKGIRYSNEQSLDYEDETGIYKLVISYDKSELFSHGLKVAQLGIGYTYEQEGNTELLYRIFMKAYKQGLIK